LSRPAALVLVATTGQMVGKCVVYWAARKGTGHSSPRVARSIERWRARLSSRPVASFGLVFLSSAVGPPPFYVMTLAGGAIGVNFRRYVIWGSASRLVRFSAIVLAVAST
jgi:membrane protein YqaA with SNARE-associated domain